MSSCRQPARGGPPSWELGEGLTAPHHKKPACYEMLHTASVAGSCEHGNGHLGSIKGGEFLE
jgi:hypothetical protein